MIIAFPFRSSGRHHKLDQNKQLLNVSERVSHVPLMSAHVFENSVAYRILTATSLVLHHDDCKIQVQCSFMSKLIGLITVTLLCFTCHFTMFELDPHV